MSVWEWILHVVVFFVVLKVAQIVFWNLRKSFFVHPWLVELLVAILVVVLLQCLTAGWWLTVLLAVLFGIVRGDQEEEAGMRRQLL
jgi:NAD(P) transhydrogenase subunit alpha